MLVSDLVESHVTKNTEETIRKIRFDASDASTSCTNCKSKSVMVSDSDKNVINN